MPVYVGKGPNFHLVSCELLQSQTKTKEERIRFHQQTCERCGFYKDTVERQRKAVRQGKPWRRLMCVHPNDKATLEKWKSHVTVFGR